MELNELNLPVIVAIILFPVVLTFVKWADSFLKGDSKMISQSEGPLSPMGQIKEQVQKAEQMKKWKVIVYAESLEAIGYFYIHAYNHHCAIELAKQMVNPTKSISITE